MSGLNKAIIIGNLGQDPDLKYTTSGTPVLNFSIAATESYQNRDGERQERTEWLRIVVWGKRAEGLNKCLSKGSRICVEGRIQTRKWEKDGVTRYSTEIVATNVVLLGGGKGGRGRQEEDPEDGPTTDDYQQDDYSDDIPF